MSTFTQQDAAADSAIKTMVTAAVGGAILPTHINWTVAASALGIGVIAIGRAYGVRITKDEAWKLIIQFIRGAGLAWAGFALGSRILSIILATTGLGYAGAVAIDSAMSAGIAYAVGECAKAYFKGEKNNKELGNLFKSTFERKKSNQ